MELTRKEIIEGLLSIHAVTANYKGDQVYIHSMPMPKLTAILYGAAELLKAETPRVLTLEEVKALPDESDVWLEEFCCIVVAATVSHALQEIPEYLRGPIPDITYFYGIEHADYHDGKHENTDYGKEWRCWTRRLTDEQMEATPWS